MKNTILLLGLIFMLTGCQSQKEKAIKSGEYWLEQAGTSAYASPQWLAALDSAIASDPNLAEAWYRKAVWYFRRDQYENAFYHLNQAAELDPVSYLNYLGWAKMSNLKDYEGAAKDFEKAVEYKAYYDVIISGTAYGRWGLALKELGEYETAIEKFDSLIALQGEEQVWVYNFIHRGLANQALGNLDEALLDFDRALDNWDKCPEAYYYKARLFQSLGQEQDACKQVRRAFLYSNLIRTNPSRPYVDQIYVSDLEVLFDEVCK